MILKDNTRYSPLTEDIKEFLPLLNIANRNISELEDEYGKNLLIYPNSFSDCDDNMEKLPIFAMSTYWEGDKCTRLNLDTGNLIGFIGIQGKNISITSRFSQSEEDDFFLHYMLKKILNINIVNLSHGTNDEKIFNLLFCFFPKFLNDALFQGLYKEYRRVEYNDANVRGTIDIKRHITQNIPFCGRVAYNSREFSYDNHVTELIRHTIEFIATNKFGRNLLQNSAETRANISQIIMATPNYKKCDRERVIKENLKIVTHPYFTKYAALQKLCVRILRHEKMKYGEKDNKIYGILFDVSYLWEEYLATILKNIGFKHPNNRKKTGTIYLAERNKFPRYPDFIRYGDLYTADAKYRTLIEQRDDIHQMVTYMYSLKSCKGIFIYPTISTKQSNTYSLLGYGDKKSTLQTYFFKIPQKICNYKDFVQEIRKSETCLEKELKVAVS